jgi:hypothetical protein
MNIVRDQALAHGKLGAAHVEHGSFELAVTSSSSSSCAFCGGSCRQQPWN